MHARYVVRLRARLAHLDVGWERDVDVVNLGLGGAGIVLDEPLHPGESVSLSFIAPTLWDPLVLRGRVAWARPVAGLPRTHRAGIAFEYESAALTVPLLELVAVTSYEG